MKKNIESQQMFEDKKKTDSDVPDNKSESAVTTRKIEDVIDPEFLKMLTQAAGGFRFMADPKLPPNRTGYTNLETKTIYYNPLLFKGMPELGIPAWKDIDVRGFALHESGHHVEPVVQFQDMLVSMLKDPSIVPTAFKGDPEEEVRFLQILHSNINNASSDIWNESYMSRYPYAPIEKDIKEFQEGKGVPKSLMNQDRPSQLVQAMLISRCHDISKVEMHKDVKDALKKIIDEGALDVMQYRGAYENPFPSDGEKRRSIENKFNTHAGVIVPEFIKLVEKELADREKQKAEEKKSQAGSGGDQGQAGDDQKQEPGSSPGGEKEQLTPEEKKAIREKLLEELGAKGKKMEQFAPSEEEMKKLEKQIGQIKQFLKAKADAEKKGEAFKGSLIEENTPEGIEALMEIFNKMSREDHERGTRGLSETYGVESKIIKEWERIKNERARDIEALTANLAEFFLDDRRKRIEYLRKEGEIVPGLEYETISSVLSGNLEPETKMRTVNNPEFLETELEFIVNTSGSMDGAKLKNSKELLVAVVEAFKKVQELLDGENLVAQDEEPFRVGVTRFDAKAYRTTGLLEPLTDKKEIQIVSNLSEGRGSTSETEALTSVYRELTLNKKNVLKIMFVLTDGDGDKSQVSSLMHQIEQDDQVVFLAVGLGETEEASAGIVETYLEPLRNRDGNVFGITATDPSQIIDKITDFLEKEVEKRRGNY